MTIFRSFICFSIVFSLLSCSSPPTKPREVIRFNPSFMLESYLIDTLNKAIGYEEYWEEDDGHTHAWGTRYVVDTLIKFETTCLYVFEDHVFFKEQGKSIQISSRNATNMKEMEGFKMMNGFYEKDSLFYYLTYTDSLKELEVPDDVDIARLIPLERWPYWNANGDYFYDDKGLYFVERQHNKRVVKIASGKNCRPVMRNDFCEYNGDAFQNAHKIGKRNRLTEIDLFRDCRYTYVTDGQTVFPGKRFADKRKIPGLDKWIQLTTGENLMVKDGNVYLEDEMTNKEVLFATPEGFRIVDEFLREKPLKINQVLIYNKGKYEPLDKKRYRLYAKAFYEYRDQFYFKSIQIENDFDMTNLKFLEDIKGGSTGWLSDGKLLTHLDCLLENTGEGNQRRKFDCVPVADIDQLKFSQQLLTDGINFYQLRERKIEVIPIEKLGFKVELHLSESAY